MRVLSLDTSSDLACVGVIEDAAVRAERSVRVSAQHGETLLPRIAEVLAEAGLARSAIDLIAVGIGPGSFTGVRIGLATAKGLAVGLGKPLVGLRTSQLLAAAMTGPRRIVAIDGKKGEVFASAWTSADGLLVCVCEDLHGAPAAVGAKLRAAMGPGVLVVAGSGALAYPELVATLGDDVTVLDEPYAAVRAGVLGSEALTAYRSRGPDDLARLEPVYVRPADALLPGGRSPGAALPSR